MRFITISTLYPNSEDPKHGIFVETRLRKYLAAYPETNVKVIAPVPWFPFRSERYGEYGRFARIPRNEQWNGLEVYHPRYLVIPKVGMLVTPVFLALSIYLCMKRLTKSFKPDFIDGHYFYPDGVAIAWVARFMKFKYYLTARGTDLNLIPEYPIPRRMIQKAAKGAVQSFTVCEALRKALIDLGESGERVTTLRNGVDLELFYPPENRGVLRKEIGLVRTTIISVGHLIERKGHHLVIEALVNLPEVDLLIAGEGPEKSNLKSLVEQFGLSQRVKFLGALRQSELSRYYGASDALVLASSREGWANVLLESMACGTPVVATDIWGTPEIIKEQVAGVLVSRSADAIAQGLQKLLCCLPERSETRKYAEKFSWDETIGGMHHFFNALNLSKRDLQGQH